MIKEQNAKEYCSEDISLIENYKKAVEDKTEIWDCHHKDEIDLNMTRTELIENGLYLNVKAERLVFLTRSEHQKLHCRHYANNKTGWNSKETRIKTGNMLKGMKRDPEAVEKGAAKMRDLWKDEEFRSKMSASHKGKGRIKHYSEEAKRRMSEAHRGKDPWNKGVKQTDEVKQKLADSIRGRKWYNDGIRCYHLRKDDPKIAQLGLKLGRLKKKGR